MLRIAILDLYEGQANQGMRGIREILNQWSEFNNIEITREEFNVRQKNEVPDLNYDIYISTGGPGSPLETDEEWEKNYFNWLTSVIEWNTGNSPKKYVFFICHSFQLACRYFSIGKITKRKSTSFGVFPVHVTHEGQLEPIFAGLNDPFYVVDSREWQVIQPDFDKINQLNCQILCIEKYRPHVPYDQAIMALRFNDYMFGTQFHPEADAIGMSMYLQTEEKKETVITNYGFEKWQSMVQQLNDPEKIMWTYSHILPNFLNTITTLTGKELIVA